ncbi:MAG: polyphosphate polymerase domain-containing protein [Bacteroidetes bacterium]|nr:polyphosphate polymerase domain-containing protein [Bacteroidota bacterium]MBU1679018.1 polyphosphate polymerase domain-containing protein [Bacteroidota bacterium]MBU2505818.1 polyphosphate polymerase domain-containing protein [Bacteroidota bacterium]
MRLEYKYLVDSRYLNDLRKDLLPFVNADSFSSSGDIPEYTVRSIYYDTNSLRFYHEKIDGIKIRKKVRIRAYNDLNNDSTVFLEIKRKNENYISKNRSQVKYHKIDELLSTGDIEGFILHEDDADRAMNDASMFLHQIYTHSLKPTVLVVYDREAFFSQFNSSLRITIDKNLRYTPFPSTSELYEDGAMINAMPSYLILEIKFYNGFPGWLQRILQKYQLSRSAVSKYTICLDHQKLLQAGRRKTTLPFINDSFSADALRFSRRTQNDV